MKRNKLIQGVGINDADYRVIITKDGVTSWRCPYYAKWVSILSRCYTKTNAMDCYDGVTVCKEWHRFSNFRMWAIAQPVSPEDLKDLQIDKDILVAGSKVYSPETCCFVTRKTNNFITDSKASRGDYPLGVYLNKTIGKFVASVCNSFTGKQEHLGTFTCPNEAHTAWKVRKHELALMLAELQTDERVKEVLKTRYL